MNPISQIDGSLIESICTKFIHKNNELCFRIMIYCKDHNIPGYMLEYNDYKSYRKNHNLVIQSMQQKNKLKNNFIPLKMGA